MTASRTSGPWRLAAILLAAVLSWGPVSPATGQDSVSVLRDGGFENPIGAEAMGWRPVPGDFDVLFDTRSPYEGRSSLRLHREATAGSTFAAVAQAVDATPYRGRTIRFRAAARAAPGSRAGLWLRVDREGGSPGFFDNMNDRPIRSPDWTIYEITGPVAADANKIAAGFLLSGPGFAWIDAASLEIVPDPAAVDGSSDPPSSEGLRNLEAFARLYGYVRWFAGASDPSDPRWTAIAVEGARDIEGARGADDLARRLRRWFEPMAPGLVIGPAAPGPATPPSEQANLWRWRHTGVAFGNPAYQSERIPVTTPEIWQAELVSGLAVSVPVTAGSSDGPPVAGAAAAAPTSSGAPEDRAVRLGGMVIAWNVFRHFYPYFGDEGRAWDQALPTWLAEAAATADGPAWLATLDRMVARLEDGHGEVGPRASTYSLPFVWQPIEGALVVTGLPRGNGSRLRVGDVVLSIDGSPAAERLAAQEERVSASTVHRRTWRAAERLLSRETAGEVVLGIETSDGERSQVVVRPIPAGAMAGVLSEPRPAPVTWLPAGAWYFDLTRLNDHALSEALDRVTPEQAVIFDLRGYPAGVDAAFLGRLSASDISTPPFRIPVGELPDARARSWKTVGWTVRPRAPRLDGRIAFLTDARAISYAETLLAMVAGYNLADIVGAPTAGTNGNGNPFALPGGYTINWTGMQVVNHDGGPLHGHGVRPTVPASRTILGVRVGQDEVLARAIALVAPAGPAT
ncbi:MAG: hypothetical protein IR159_09080 [Brevundimonas sp.]|nr:hypothetical protein [Brevundimonas sp.]